MHTPMKNNKNLHMKNQIIKTLTLSLSIFSVAALFMGCDGNAQSKSKSVATVEKNL